jgi:hypothetical protein
MLVPAGFENAIRACTERDLPATRPWFQAELQQVLEDQPKPFDKRRWRDLPRAEIVKGAVRQIPGYLPQYHALWMEVIKIPEFATLAVYSLRSEPINAIEYLEAWWAAKPPAAEHDLRRFLVEIRTRHHPNQILSYIRRLGASWTPEFRIKIVNPLCLNLGFGLPFPPLD